MRSSPSTCHALAFGYLLLAACGDANPDTPAVTDAASDGGADAAIDGGPGRGARQAYVVAQLVLPAAQHAIRQFGFDLVGDAAVDNRFGELVVWLRGLNLERDIDLITPTQRAVDDGRIVTLVDLYFDGTLADSEAASIWLGPGADPMPSPCAGPGDTVCRRHLRGDGVFSRGGPPGPPLAGRIAAGTFTGGPGLFALPVATRLGTVLRLPLERVYLELPQLSPLNSSTGSLGGALRVTHLHDQLLPAVHLELETLFAADCPPPRTPPLCSCREESGGESIMWEIDTDDDCVLTVAETRSHLARLAPPDLDLDGDGQLDALSVGVGLHGVAATFPEP